MTGKKALFCGPGVDGSADATHEIKQLPIVPRSKAGDSPGFGVGSVTGVGLLAVNCRSNTQFGSQHFGQHDWDVQHFCVPGQVESP
ncbi:hypothetical protein BV898_15613 [Hypsibius exemplaris]|uniref:Uncharacterized protein n=1 Tax=Hypsibius exemplaris TaxID=2072580 RepID=A0A9X6NKH6_HYPEX|nr:hypothetical protein BV898_15613 [Hypsibius exemplaris]